MDVALPRAALNAVIPLPGEVLLQVVDDQSALKRAAKPRQVLDKGSVDLRSVLSVEPVGDQISVLVELVEDEIGVRLMGRCEDNYFIELGHVSEESDA